MPKGRPARGAAVRCVGETVAPPRARVSTAPWERRDSSGAGRASSTTPVLNGGKYGPRGRHHCHRGSQRLSISRKRSIPARAHTARAPSPGQRTQSRARPQPSATGSWQQTSDRGWTITATSRLQRHNGRPGRGRCEGSEALATRTSAPELGARWAGPFGRRSSCARQRDSRAQAHVPSPSPSPSPKLWRSLRKASAAASPPTAYRCSIASCATVTVARAAASP